MDQARRRELIGVHIKVIGADNPNLIGLEGNVVDETKNLLVLEDGKKIIKAQVTIEVNGVVLKGEDINKRPEERLRK